MFISTFTNATIHDVRRNVVPLPKLYIATNCNIVVFMTLCIYRYIHITALYLYLNLPHLSVAYIAVLLRYLQFYEGKSLNNRNFIITFYKSTYRNCFRLIFRHSPPSSQHTWSTCPQACGCLLQKSSTCCFTVSLATLTGLPIRCSSLTLFRPF